MRRIERISVKAKIHLLAALVCAVCSVQAAPIRIKGSDTLGALLVPRLCELYRTQEPEVGFEISADGSDAGFASLLDGTADIGMSARLPAGKEVQAFTDRNITLRRWDAAMDAYVVVVHPRNPVSGLSAKQVESIFAGDVAQWAATGGNAMPIVIYLRNSTAFVNTDFRRMAMNGRPYGANLARLATAETPLVLVARDVNGIAFSSRGWVRRSVRTDVKVLRIDDHEPEGEKEAAYPFLRPLYYFAIREPSARITAFLDWATRSDLARKAIIEAGFSPVRSALGE